MRWQPLRGQGDVVRRPPWVNFNTGGNDLFIKALEEDNPFIWTHPEAVQHWAEQATDAAEHDEREARINLWQRQQDTAREPHDARMLPTLDPRMRAQLLELVAASRKPVPPHPRSMMLPYPGEYWPGPMPKEKPIPMPRKRRR